ncbi:hypothetical protein [Pseudomonas putida]|jgi:hypothetical protein|uniref:hypothetical protein n=1 Tax=Pseudomonas putida TaxID=303 RepID=UPI000980990A|nr:hypothetical protein [Pseudomonas putida]OMQ41048.1 hypothetical protein BKX96_04450 [Pseudomonas putida]
MIELGQKAEDKVTEFYGTIVARATYLTGCDRYLLQPPSPKGANVVLEPEWFDEERIQILNDRLPSSIRRHR